MRRILALDMGTRNVKAALMEDTGKAFRAIRLESVGREQFMLAGPRAFLKQAHLPTSSLVATFPSSLCSLRNLILPSTVGSRLGEAAKYACEKSLPRPIENMVVGFESGAKAEAGVNAVAAAALKSDIQHHIAPLQADRIELLALIPDAAATLSLCPFAPSAPGLPFAILDIGASSSKLVISQEGTSAFVKAIRLGADSLSPPPHEATAHPPEPGEPQTPHSVHAPALARLAGEIKRAFLLAPADTKPEKLWLCGGGALINGLQHQLSAELAIPTETADALAWLGAEPRNSDGTFFAAAVGAAVAALRRKRLPLDLLKEEFRPRTRLEKLTSPLTTSLALMAVILGVLLISRLALNSRLDAQLHEVLTRQRQISRQILGLEATGSALSMRLQSRLKELQQTTQSHAPVRGTSALSTFSHLASFVPPDGSIQIRSLNITQSGVTANMLAASRADIDDLIDSINAAGLLVASAGETVPKGDEIGFTLNAEIKEPK